MSATTLTGASASSFRPFSDDAPLPERASPAMRAFLAANRFDRPTMVLELDRVSEGYRALKAGLDGTHIHYAVKANPHPAVLERLVAEGSRFDAASRGEIEACFRAGAGPEDVSFGNTVKRPADIAWAFARGIDLFAVDAEEEILKVAAHAPGARVFLRVLVEESEAAWPLSRKFGAAPGEAVRLMHYARALGLRPVGLSFHVGSQTAEARMWQRTLDMVQGVWEQADAEGLTLDVLNIGGGFPAFYGDPVQETVAYGRELMTAIRHRFGQVGTVMAEPGRGLVAQAGLICAEVLLVSRKRRADLARWVYLDIGKFSGLAETMDEAIRYQIETSADGGETGPCILAGPSCDSADVLYEKRPMALPTALRAGDRVWIHAAGAYTSSYSSVGFNGFPPLDAVCF